MHHPISPSFEPRLTAIPRFSRSFCRRDSGWRADQNHGSHQKNLESLLERDLRLVSRQAQKREQDIDTDIYRRASEDSILAVQIFDQKKFKKKDQGFLGVINVRVGDVVDFSSGQDRE